MKGQGKMEENRTKQDKTTENEFPVIDYTTAKNDDDKRMQIVNAGLGLGPGLVVGTNADRCKS
jgi:hypothetical protein